MISRILVPKDARLSAASPNGVPHRTTSALDERALVPSDLPHFELDPRTSIPEHLPLDVLSPRIVVPRNMPHTPLDARRNIPEYVHLDILESRVAVPSDAHPQNFESKAPVPIQDLPDVLEPDVITTGEINLLPAHVEERTSAWTGGDKVSLIGLAASLAVEIGILLIMLFAPPLSHPVGTNEIARDNFTDLYLPPDVKDLTKIAPKPTPQVRIDPRVLKNLNPSVPFSPPPGPVAPPASQPAPQIPQQAPPVAIPKPAAPAPVAPAAQPDSPIRAPQRDTASSELVLPRFSPGKALEQSLHEALKNGGTPTSDFGGPVRPSPNAGYGGGVPGGGGGGQGYLGGSLQLLTPTEGVDFSGYLERMKAIVERNWYAVMPESAQLGEKGRVILQFRVMRNGAVPPDEPAMMGSSGKEPLDRAASSSIRASSPFEPLPSAFSGPYIELRFIFLYNLPIDAAQ